MLGMFWIALELSNPMVGLITRFSLLAKNFTAFKYGKVAKSGNAVGKRLRSFGKTREVSILTQKSR